MTCPLCRHIPGSRNAQAIADLRFGQVLVGMWLEHICLPRLPGHTRVPCLSALVPLFLLSFLVTPHGCSVTLACGVRLQFPAGATTTPVTIHYRLWLPEPGLVSLGPHDFLLSGVLELQPHGVAFQKVCPGWVGGRCGGLGLAPSHTPVAYRM